MCLLQLIMLFEHCLVVLWSIFATLWTASIIKFYAYVDISGFIQASLSKIQGLFKDFKTILQFSRTKSL